MRPQLIIIAGAPGSGKSRAFPVSKYEVDFFNADDRAAELSGGYHGISMEIRTVVNREFEAFITDHIRSKRNFAFETTLRSSIIFDQMDAAFSNDFEITMLYIGIDDPQINLARIALRWELGYHAAPADLLMAIHAKSYENLRRACREAFAGRLHLILHDNAAIDKVPLPVFEITGGTVRALVETPPTWVRLAVNEALPGGSDSWITTK